MLETEIAGDELENDELHGVNKFVDGGLKLGDTEVISVGDDEIIGVADGVLHC